MKNQNQPTNLNSNFKKNHHKPISNSLNFNLPSTSDPEK
ncbi:hypothetical protein BVRB_4g074380 [Beta vulgaris subsp. vulgaris]|nr:hypothetical protein BVRB_4g074380 [Beta vulgaris subsp. vulgaris]